MATKKTATADVFEFPTFDMTKVADGYREMADKSVNQTKEAYAKAKTAAEDATKAIETTLETAQAGTVELSLKAIDAARGNVEHSLSHMEALLGVKSVAQMIELQTSFFRKQAEMMVDQTKMMQEAAKKVAEDVSKPTKTIAEKAMSEIKAA
ncbi:MAG: phasin family protein [Hoeflea sp.]|uniref:phasin family protein n=1 Tax=Hoeflea sp. TaxID=1940281 RepID=UPI001D9D2455|nr:phasin family protein [Hoeflea sp.]MBU4528908.1 phasin family protein [Alphaproteobacteria bacterium]MBU4544041.1 phasin family protein [Alphaproteobacteria bacterium]MBU4551910.1 phasin family protein [Alphaproteobacteria bacterium]MBV1723375.1 phasin family protein [Hoeflea sp.]MBV1760354.1 phasin family protein [Hoeflea sp.]